MFQRRYCLFLNKTQHNKNRNNLANSLEFSWRNRFSIMLVKETLHIGSWENHRKGQLDLAVYGEELKAILMSRNGHNILVFCWPEKVFEV